MAYKTHSSYKFTNSQELIVESWNDEKILLRNSKNILIELEMKYTASFKPRYAMTVYKSQGSTFSEKFSIYEHKSMKSSMLYVAMTRARNKEQVNFCEIKDYQPHTGHIYCYEYQGKYYIGSTKDLNKRKQEHKNGTKAGDTKFKKAIEIIGFDNFNYKVLKTIRFNDIHELWELENSYIKKFNSVENGFNVRYNTLENI